MGRRVKTSQERCAQCKYSMNISSGKYTKTNVYTKACDYIGKNKGESRVFKNGKYRDDYEPGYCNFFERKKKT